MQKTEVSNAEFRLFLNDLKAIGNLDAYHSYYPDSLGWQAANVANKPFDTYYFTNPAFNNYPVVNISYEAAEAYCYWLGAKYNALNNQPFGKVVFKLPTHEQWMKAGSGGKADGRQFPWNGLYLQNNRGERLCNFKPDSTLQYKGDAGKIKNKEISASPKGTTQLSAPVNAFFPNDIGLYNVCGNVAEMLADKGVAAGGSFDDFGYNVRIQSTKQFSGPSHDIGFRVLMERSAH
jgi:formylglycine-generating enzyme required for sulfatase activity